MQKKKVFQKKLEKKAEELYQRAQAYAEQKSKEKNAETADPLKPIHTTKELKIDTKYSRSLEDIKDEYTSWLLDQKRNKRRPVIKTSITVAATVLLLVIGYTAAKIVFKKDDKSVIAKQSISPTDPEKPAIKKTDLSSNKTIAKPNRKKTTPVVTKSSISSRKKN